MTKTIWQKLFKKIIDSIEIVYIFIGNKIEAIGY